MPIKTLHITNHYHPASGGIRTFYLALLEAANTHRREVRLVVPGAENSIENVGAFGRIYTIAAPPCPVFDSRYHLLLPHLYLPPYPSALRRILREEQPDVVEVCDKYALSFLPAVLRRGWMTCPPPAVFVGLSCERMDDNVSAYINSGHLGRKYAAWFVKTMYAPRFDCHICNSDYTAGELREALQNRPDTEVHVRPMGVHLHGFTPDRRRDAVREALLHKISVAAASVPPRRVLLFVGRLSPEKNLEILPAMMENLAGDSSAEYHLVLAGDGPRAGWLREKADRATPGRVHLLGHVADRDYLADLYANCDALVHPNAREPFGITPLEAMASGLPVVAPSAGGLLSYADDGNAWLVRPVAADFAAGVRAVFAEEATKSVKVERAIQTAAKFDWCHVTASFFELYDGLYARFEKARMVAPRHQPKLAT